MIAVAVALLVQNTQPLAVPQSVELLASGSILHSRLGWLILDDPALRGELRRVGFDKGCRALATSRNEVAARFASELAPATSAAIRKIVPAERIDAANPRAFLVGPMTVYRDRIANELGNTAGDTLARAETDVRAGFLQRTRSQPDVSDPKANIVVPRPDIARALNLGATYDLDNPAQLGMACAELLISPANRPAISGGGPVR